jgi:hypothetical protein
MASLREQMKIAKKAAKEGKMDTAWSSVKMARGDKPRCVGCQELWAKMSKARLIAHMECDDSDGCPDTKG